MTIAALAAMGDDDELDMYLRRGLESGLARALRHGAYGAKRGTTGGNRLQMGSARNRLNAAGVVWSGRRIA